MTIEQLTVTLSYNMAEIVKEAVEIGDDRSNSEVVQGTLRDWGLKRALQLETCAVLQADILRGLPDLAEKQDSGFRHDPYCRTKPDAIERPLTLRLIDTAGADLAEIWFSLATEADEEVANRFVAGTEAACERLRYFPLSGAGRDRLAAGGSVRSSDTILLTR